MAKFLVTGGAGFIGSHLVERLMLEGHQVSVLDDFSRPIKDARKFLSGAQIFEGSVTDVRLAKEVTNGVSQIFHLAAISDVKQSMKEKRKTMEVNFRATQKLLDISTRNRVKVFVFPSTAAVYSRPKYLPIDESHPVEPKTPYAESKLKAEQAALDFKKKGLLVSILRFFNCYGPRQQIGSVIPDIITQAINQEVIKLGNLFPTRDFLFVEDAVDALLAAALNKSKEAIFNIGSGNEISVGELAETVLSLTKKKRELVQVQEKKRGEEEIHRSVANVSKARKFLGWEPKTQLSEGLNLTINYFREAR